MAASLHLVTGYDGGPHITSADQGLFNAGCLGSDEYVLAIGNRFEAQIVTNNSVRIYDGSLSMQGRHVNVPYGATLMATIENGTSGKKRHDIIAVRYSSNNTTGIESASLVVHKGVETTGTPTDPTMIYQSSILNGADIHDMPLYRVVIEGLTITKVEPLFQVLAPLSDIQQNFYKQNLLINGDFQCNQRGRTTYDIGNSSAYSVDMWRIHQIKLEVLAEGVKLTGKSASATGYFTQFVDVVKHKDEPHTISAMVDDKIYTFTVTLTGEAQEKDCGKFKITALRTSTWNDGKGDYDNRLKINICPVGTNSVVVKYVDLFDGTIAYPHKREDSAIALMRCRRYIQHGATISPTLYLYTSGSTYAYRFAITHDPMATTPTLEECSWHYFNTAGTDATGDVGDVEILSNSNGIVQLRTIYGSQKNAQCNGIRIVYVLSCEHAPTGD